jgi:hypothetical protein
MRSNDRLSKTHLCFSIADRIVVSVRFLTKWGREVVCEALEGQIAEK